MTGMGYAGAFVVATAVVFLVTNLFTAYKTEGGSIGQVPVMAPPIFAPFSAICGIALVDRDTGWPGWPFWLYVLVWIGTTLAAWYATAYAGELGKRKE